jgi:hypothetical protein
MKNLMKWTFKGTVLVTLFLSLSASAESKMSLNSELVGIENVLSVISNVNIRQVDSKTNQTVTDIMEAKGQMYQPGLRLGQPEKQTQVATYGKRPPSSQRHRTF